MSTTLIYRRVPWIATVGVLLVIAALLAWYVLRGQQHKLVTDPAAYGPSLTYFKNVSELAPQAIPPEAQDVNFRFEWRYFMLGPTRLTLDATFTLPPAEAKKWIGETRNRLPQAVVSKMSEGSLIVGEVVGDESVRVIADTSAGRIEIHLRTPPASSKR